MPRLSDHDFEVDKAVKIGPVRVTIYHDSDPLNPWDWDCQTPLLWASWGRNGYERVETEDSGDDIQSFFRHVTPAWAARHRAKIYAALDVSDAAQEEADIREDAKTYRADRGDLRLERFADILGEITGEDLFDCLAELYSLKGWPALSFQKTGYCQGDYVAGLLVATPAHAERCGFRFDKPGHDIAASLESDAELFGAWAFGDVYGYTITDKHGEPLDSCCGYYGVPYGCNPRNDGAWDVLEAAQEALDGIAGGQAAKARAKAAKARKAFLAARREFKAAALPGGAKVPNLCEMLDSQVRKLAVKWRRAKANARAWAALTA